MARGERGFGQFQSRFQSRALWIQLTESPKSFVGNYFECSSNVECYRYSPSHCWEIGPINAAWLNIFDLCNRNMFIGTDGTL